MNYLSTSYKAALKRKGLQFFAMPNLDTIKEQKLQLLAKMNKAIGDNDQDAYLEAMEALCENIQQSIMPDIQEWKAMSDNSILTARGCRVLTSEEKKYYEGLIECWKAPDPKQALTNFSIAMPETVINGVFDDITTNHPLLSAITFTNTEAMMKILLSTGGAAAKWGKIDAAYEKELAADFVQLDLTLCTLSAFIPVARYMLDVGPEWVDRYVRTLLSESIALGLEYGIVNGDGKDAPIGMNRKLTGAVDGVYPEKAPIKITELTPASYAQILGTLSQGPNDTARDIPSVLMVVNPTDYFTKVYPATTVRRTDGGWNTDVFPFPTTVAKSTAVPAGKAIMGLAPQYFMGIGGGTSGGRVEFSNEVKWVERLRLYGVFLYGYGRAKTENDFVYLDISELKAHVLEVKVEDAAVGA